MWASTNVLNTFELSKNFVLLGDGIGRRFADAQSRKVLGMRVQCMRR
jgi:hypothetical protein